MTTENKAYARTTKSRKKQPVPFNMAEKETDKVSKQVKIADQKKILSSISDRLAQDQFHYIHQYWPGGREAFPGNVSMQTVGKFYPYAVGGPLYVDEPMFDFQVAECKKKEPFLRQKGLRYVLILPRATFDECLPQLGEVTSCGQQQSQTYAS